MSTIPEHPAGVQEETGTVSDEFSRLREKAVLGTILLYPASAPKLFDRLQDPDVFRGKTTRIVFEVFQKLYNEGYDWRSGPFGDFRIRADLERAGLRGTTIMLIDLEDSADPSIFLNWDQMLQDMEDAWMARTLRTTRPEQIREVASNILKVVKGRDGR